MTATFSATGVHERRESATVVSARLEHAPAEQIIEWAVETFGHRFCVTSSMTDGVLSHLASRVAPGIDVLFVDTGLHLVETLGTRDAVAATTVANVVTLSPRITVRGQASQHGPRLWERDPDLCCELRKVQPLDQGLEPYDAWAAGRRREETRDRVVTPVVGWDDITQKVKVSPLARWTSADVDRYITEHDVVVNPLRFDGYPSVGCWPCTRSAQPAEDAAAGRWPRSDKAECGIHS